MSCVANGLRTLVVLARCKTGLEKLACGEWKLRVGDVERLFQLLDTDLATFWTMGISCEEVIFGHV
jgi:hypothetical protein